MPRQPVALPWWSRILLIVGSMFAVVPLIMVVDTIGVFGSMILPYAWLLVASVVIERLRGGNHVTLGLPLHASSLHHVGKGALSALGAVAAVVLVIVGIGGTWTVDLRLLDTPVLAVSSVGLTVMLAAGEELLFRGVVFQALHERFGAATAVLATSVPFGLAHLANPDAGAISTINTIMAGVALGAMVTTYRSLWVAIGFHAAWNVGVAAAVGPLSGWDMMPFRFASVDTTMLDQWRWLVDGPYGIEEGAMTTIALVIIVIGTLRSNRYDAVVEAARYRRLFGEQRRTYTPLSAASSVQPEVPQLTPDDERI
ncbi:MAG: CPBP family intramembrane metalloprotease [Candidatus Kapabacteria bacterium]|nr:CPBP family intramembrane metalloprotease [Candidatus Kapabacteria bacterium]